MTISEKKLGRWYRETSQHLKAGLPLPQALEAAGGIPRTYRRRLAEELRAGTPVEDAFAGASRWMPEVDRRVLGCASQSGKMAETFGVLAKKRDFLGRQGRKAMGAILYPLFVIHFAVILLMIYLMFTGSPGEALRVVLPIVLVLWGGVAILGWSVRRRHRWVRFLMLWIPLLRGYRRNQAVADLCFALHGYVTAGQSLDQAWAAAGAACGDRRLLRLSEAVAETARAGSSPAAKMATSGVLPEDFVSLYQTGETTGQLEENLYFLWQIYSERAAGNLSAAGFWYPKVFMIVIIVGVGYAVVTAYAAYLDGLMDLL